jgi:hypothetical protein
MDRNGTESSFPDQVPALDQLVPAMRQQFGEQLAIGRRDDRVVAAGDHEHRGLNLRQQGVNGAESENVDKV